MRHFEVRLTARAEDDIRETYDYIKRHGPADPDDWKAGLAGKLSSLEEFPTWAPLAPESEHTREEIRQILYGPFRVLFLVRNDVVYVLTVRHGAREFLRPRETENLRSEAGES